ncbi:MAG: restriction endonuclease [Kiritimatiellae bacterium]|nr:restriction endonuclease [Kiritimatiellia bacterium]MBQ6008442.1 restriction endonuclease [Kiritimatiellia bacterium]
MANNDRAKKRIAEAIDILGQFGLPRAQINERTAYCLLGLLNVTPGKTWQESESPLVGITPMMDFAREHYGKNYAPNTRETFRRFSMHQMVQAGIAIYNPDKPDRPTNSPKAAYQISPAAIAVIKSYGCRKWTGNLATFKSRASTLAAQYAKERQMDMVQVKVRKGLLVTLSPGKHNELIRAIIEEMAPRFLHGATLVYIGDTGEKWGFFDDQLAEQIGLPVEEHGKMPDVILWLADKEWLVLVESVTSHGPVDAKRRIELADLFASAKGEKIYISAFPDKRTFARFAPDVAWETETWVADNPTHMVHFNGDKFLGPYK